MEPGSYSHHTILASCLPALGQGQGADCHELGQDAVPPEKPVEAAMGGAEDLGQQKAASQKEPGLGARSSFFLPSSPWRSLSPNLKPQVLTQWFRLEGETAEFGLGVKSGIRRAGTGW